MRILLLFCLAGASLVPDEATAGLLTGARANEIKDPGTTTSLALTCNGDSDNCASVPTPSRSLRTAPAALTASLSVQSLRLQYLGTGGVFIERCRGAGPCEAIMTAPFFSQASLGALGLCEVESDPAVVREAMNKLLDSTELGTVRAVLAGHSHHDHILDLPTVLTAFASSASAYGNRTMRNILRASGVPPADLIAMNGQAIDATTTTATWTTIPGQSIRFVALESEHAPNMAAPFFSFLSVNFAQGSVFNLRGSLPRRARGWKEGQTLAFLIDFLDSAGNVAYRFYYQDTPFAPPDFHSIQNLVRLGLDPVPRNVDMAILCVATANFEKNYFQQVDRHLRARHYLLTHWEDFFKGYSLDAPSLTAVNVTDPEGVIKDLRRQVGVGASWVLPAPGTILP